MMIVPSVIKFVGQNVWAKNGPKIKKMQNYYVASTVPAAIH